MKIDSRIERMKQEKRNRERDAVEGARERAKKRNEGNKELINGTHLYQIFGE